MPHDPTWEQPQYPPLQSHPKYGYKPFHLIPGVDNPPDCRDNNFNFDTSKRIGMIGRKIGMTLQWLDKKITWYKLFFTLSRMNDGTRYACTMIHFPQNVVLSANDPSVYFMIFYISKSISPDMVQKQSNR